MANFRFCSLIFITFYSLLHHIPCINANSLPLQQPIPQTHHLYKDYPQASESSEHSAAEFNFPLLDGIKGVQIQNGYSGVLAPDVYSELLETFGVKPDILSYLKPLIPETAVKVIKAVAKVAAVAAGAVLVVIVSTVIATAFCTVSNLCAIQFAGFEFQKDNLEESVRAYLSPEKLSSVSEFVHSAIAKYKKIKKKKMSKL